MSRRYFFDTTNGGLHPDVEGEPLDDHEQAKIEATKILADMLRMRHHDFVQTGELKVMVIDEDRTPIYRVRAVIEDLSAD